MALPTANPVGIEGLLNKTVNPLDNQIATSMPEPTGDVPNVIGADFLQSVNSAIIQPKSVSAVDLISKEINKIDNEQAIINSEVTSPRPHSVDEYIALQNTIQDFATSTQAASKVVSTLTKGIDGLVHTQ